MYAVYVYLFTNMYWYLQSIYNYQHLVSDSLTLYQAY